MILAGNENAARTHRRLDQIVETLRAVLRSLRLSPRAASQLAIVTLAFVLGQPDSRSIMLGAGIAFVGEGLRIWSAGFGYRRGQISLRGPYRFVRYPYFLGTILLLAGVVVASRSLVTALFAALVLTWFYQRAVRRDEGRLAEALGPLYSMYKARVSAFMPQLLPAQLPAVPGDTQPFSLRLAVLRGRKRELDVIIAMAATFGLLFATSTLADKRLWQGGVVLFVGLVMGFRFIYYRRSRAA